LPSQQRSEPCQVAQVMNSIRKGQRQEVAKEVAAQVAVVARGGGRFTSTELEEDSMLI
jgi:hypothetical protein